MAAFSDYERRALQEIELWKAQRRGALSQIVQYVSHRAPARWVAEHVPAVPERITRPMLRAVQGFLELLKDGAYWTYSDESIVRAARREGLDVDRIASLASQELEVLDRVARGFFAQNKIASALEGAGAGLGGLALIAADVPAVFMVAFRAIQQIGASYGFDMKDPNATPLVMSVLGFASGAEEFAKVYSLADLHLAARMYAKGWTFDEVAERTATGGAAFALRQAARKMPQEIAKNVTKKKLAQLIPLVGAAVGAGFNYWFIANTSRTAYMLFREMHLAQKHPAPAT